MAVFFAACCPTRPSSCRPDHVPSSELFNFLSRVPDDPTLSRCKPLSVMDEDLLREEEERKGGGGGAGGGGGGGDTLTAGKLAKKVSSFFAGGGSKQVGLLLCYVHNYVQYLLM